MSRALAWVLAVGGAAGLASCALVAGLGDYELAKGDASVVDASGDGPAADVEDGANQADTESPDDASPDRSAAPDANDATAPIDSAIDDSGSALDDASEGGSGRDGPAVPPSDKDHLLCGKSTCSLTPQPQVCCEQLDADTCQASFAPCTGGTVEACDEAANCPLNQVCCVTGMGPAGLETSCRAACQGGTQGQSCRTSAECPGGAQPCVAWTCAGDVVATCGGAGSSTGCH